MQQYNSTKFKEEFPNTELGKSITGTCVWNPVVLIDRIINLLSITDRKFYETPIIGMTVFWYISFLLEKQPTQIIDIGCGSNTFKKYIPIIYGIDPHYESADEKDFFDDSFSKGHMQAYESVMSINALHFISLANYGLRLREFSNIIKSGGRGFITFNVERMKERTVDNDFKLLFGTTTPSNKQLSEYILAETKNNLQNILAYDDYLDICQDECLNGNIRIVFDN